MPEIKLYKGDALEILKQLESKSVNLIFADPHITFRVKTTLHVKAGKLQNVIKVTGIK
jgi:DNA modification methylase